MKTRNDFKNEILLLCGNIDVVLSKISKLEGNDPRTRIETCFLLYFLGELRDKFVLPVYSPELVENNFWEFGNVSIDVHNGIYTTTKIMILDTAKLFKFTEGQFVLMVEELSNLRDSLEMVSKYMGENFN